MCGKPGARSEKFGHALGTPRNKLLYQTEKKAEIMVRKEGVFELSHGVEPA
jgi:hypothetical protein